MNSNAIVPVLNVFEYVTSRDYQARIVVLIDVIFFLLEGGVERFNHRIVVRRSFVTVRVCGADVR